MDPPVGPPSGPYDYDLLVIGGGSGGLAVAKEAAGLQKKVLVVDLAATRPAGTPSVMGGSSLNALTARAFLQQAALLGQAIRDSQKYGWRSKAEAAHSWSELMEGVRERLRTKGSEWEREMGSCGGSYLQARGRIVAPHTVEVTGVDGIGRRVTAEALVIATGGTPRRLGVPGDTEHCVTGDDLLSLPGPPGRTLVVGGSAEALEWAGFLRGLGMPVRVVLPRNRPLPRCFDGKTVQKIENHMFVGGVDFLRDCSLTKVERVGDCSEDGLSGDPAEKRKLRVTITKQGQTKQEDYDTVLLALGKKASTGDIGLECVGVKCSQETGKILVNDMDQTSVEHIYAIGSVQHGRAVHTTGLSVHSGTLLARRLCSGDGILCDYTHVPTAVLTPMEYAACGLSEEKAHLTFGEANVEVYHSYYWPVQWELPARNKNSCYVKVICHIPDHERVVGLHVLGPNAGDILQGFAAAMKCGLTKQQMDATVGIRPGTAQVLTSLTQTQRMTEALTVRGNC